MISAVEVAIARASPVQGPDLLIARAVVLAWFQVQVLVLTLVPPAQQVLIDLEAHVHHALTTAITVLEEVAGSVKAARKTMNLKLTTAVIHLPVISVIQTSTGGHQRAAPSFMEIARTVMTHARLVMVPVLAPASPATRTTSTIRIPKPVPLAQTSCTPPAALSLPALSALPHLA